MSNELELLSDSAEVFDIFSRDAFNDRLLFLLSFRSFSLLTLLSFDGDVAALIAGRCGTEMFRIFSSCLRSTTEKNSLQLQKHFSVDPPTSRFVHETL